MNVIVCAECCLPIYLLDSVEIDCAGMCVRLILGGRLTHTVFSRLYMFTYMYLPYIVLICASVVHSSTMRINAYGFLVGERYYAHDISCFLILILNYMYLHSNGKLIFIHLVIVCPDNIARRYRQVLHNAR